jgi:hypothetical protein
VPGDTIEATPGIVLADSRNDIDALKLSPGRPQVFVDKLWMNFMLATRNGNKSSAGAVCSPVVLTTMKSQQAVANRFVGRRVNRSTCLFFSFSTALRAFTSLRDMSLR